MLYGWLGDGVVLVHLAFLVFVAVGGLLAWRWRPVVWVHLPAVVWSLLSITVGLDCPLTPLEKHFRRLAGGQGYPGGFVDHYVEGVIYPARFTPALRALVGAAIIVAYAGLVQMSRRAGARTRPGRPRRLVRPGPVAAARR